METSGAGRDNSSVTLRFLAAPTDVADLGGTVISGGTALEWVDRGAYACAVGWSSAYCVTAYVGDVAFARPIHTGQMVEVSSRIIFTGRSSMHIAVTVSAGPVASGELRPTATCIVIFVALDAETKRPVPVPPWEPRTPEERRVAARAQARIGVRKDIEHAMSQQTYSDRGTAPTALLRFLAAPTDVNWGGKTHGGTVMRWIDETARVCALQWSGMDCLPVYSGGIRFYSPVPIGNLVEISARLVHTGRSSMHISVHVRSADPKIGEFTLTTHCMSVFVALQDGRPVETPSWEPLSQEDKSLDAHALDLMRLRATKS